MAYEGAACFAGCEMFCQNLRKARLRDWPIVTVKGPRRSDSVGFQLFVMETQRYHSDRADTVPSLFSTHLIPSMQTADVGTRRVGQNCDVHHR